MKFLFCDNSFAYIIHKVLEIISILLCFEII